MKASSLTLTLTAADDDGIVTTVNPANNAALTLNGALASGGVAVLDQARRVCVYSSGDDTLVLFTVTGTDRYGRTVSDSFYGSNASQAYSSVDFKTVTAIQTTGNASQITVGTNKIASTPWYPVDVHRNPFELSCFISFSDGAVAEGQVEYTETDIQEIANYDPVVRVHATLNGISANDDGRLQSPVRAVRGTVTDWTSGSVTFTFQQAGLRGA